MGLHVACLDGIETSRQLLLIMREVGSVTHDFGGHLVLKLKRRNMTLPVSEPYEHPLRRR